MSGEHGALRCSNEPLIINAPNTIEYVNWKETERALRESEWLYQSAFEEAPVGFCHMDLKGNYLKVNRRFCEILGYSHEELLSMSFREVTHPEDLPRDEEAVCAGLAGALSRHQGEKRYVRKNGEVIWCSRTASAHFGRDGELKHCLVAIDDITEQKRSEQRIREQANLLNLARDAIYVQTVAGEITFWNRGAELIYGWSGKEAVGGRMDELMAPDSGAQDRGTRLKETGEWHAEVRRRARDGREVIVNSRWTLIRNELGEPSAYFIIDTDITENKRLEQEFYRAQRMEGIGMLASGIAHDLNNILTPIMMSVQLLRCGLSPEDQEESLATVQQCAERGADIVKQVLTFGRGIKGDKIPVQPAHLVKEMAKIARETFPRNIRIECNIRGQLHSITGDATQLHQVLMNLTVNARDAMPEGGLLKMEAENVSVDQQFAAMVPEASVGEYVRFRVADTGCGIPRENLEKLFLPFFSTKGPQKGTGLGLSTVLGIVRNHGGFLRVQSQVGAGSGFDAYIPARTDAAVAPKEPSNDAAPRGAGETVLVVDDENSVREVLQKTLESGGYRVITAADGVEGFTTYTREKDKISLVLTDIMMPVLDGVAFTRAIKRINAQARVLATSGLADDGDFITKRQELAQMGVETVLTKPYFARDLLREVKNALNPSPVNPTTSLAAV